MNLDTLEPFNAYLVALDRLDNAYIDASNLFEQIKWEIEWNGKTSLIKQIPNIYNSLKKQYVSFKVYYNNLKKNYASLTEYEKEIFDCNKEIKTSAKILLNELDEYSSTNQLYFNQGE